MNIYEELSNILEEDIAEDTVLQECEMWDSLAIMSIMALAAVHSDNVITIAMVKQATTAKDIADLLGVK